MGRRGNLSGRSDTFDEAAFDDRRHMVWSVQRRFLGEVHASVDAVAVEAAGSITLSNPHGKYPITGTVHGKAIQFGAVAQAPTSTGSVSGNSMSGSYKTGQGGGKWSAHKTS